MAHNPRLIRLRWRWPQYDIANGLRMNPIPGDVKEILLDIAEGREPWPLLLIGVFGCGKTSLARLILHHAAGGRYWKLWDFHKLTWPDSTKDPWADFKGAGLAVLDDVGDSGKASDGEARTLKACLDAREFAPLILVSNKSLDDLDELYGGAIASRLGVGTRITGEQFGKVDQRWPVKGDSQATEGKRP